MEQKARNEKLRTAWIAFLLIMSREGDTRSSSELLGQLLHMQCSDTLFKKEGEDKDEQGA